MDGINAKALRELQTMEGALWSTWGRPLMDGCLDEAGFRERLMSFAVDSYRLGLLTAVNVMERRMGRVN